MIHRNCHIALAAVLATQIILHAAPAHAQDIPLIPRAVFFGNPERTNVQISPQGDQISFLAPDANVLNVWVRAIDDDQAGAVTSARSRPIRSYFWAYNGEQIIYLQDREGNEQYHLYAVTIDTGDEIDLTPIEGVKARLITADRNFPDEILIGLNNRDPRFHDVWRVNTRTGERTLVFENTDGYFVLDADSNFDIRLAAKMDPQSGRVDLLTRDTVDDPWYQLVRYSPEDTAGSGWVGFSRNGRTLYLTDSRNRDTAALFAYASMGVNGPSYDEVASHLRVDVADIVRDPATGRPQAVAFDFTRREWQILDPDLRTDWEYLGSVVEGEVTLESRDVADRLWIVSYAQDDGPTRYYLYDRNEVALTFLFSDRPALENLPLAKMKPVVIPARDGLELVSYLTLPPGGPARNAPMVLLVHGGPWSRDGWGYRPLHQWLANRGYAVLSVNFRGSTGFGKQFLNAGNREWAGRMHDDLIDAVNWAVEEGFADPDRVAIMGGSYGGYATLVGLTFTPEFFAAGVDIVGPSHVQTLLESIPPDWVPIVAMFENRVGSLSEPEFLDQISPLSRVDEIERPLLIGQGRNDPRVKETESRQIVEAMREKNLPVTYVLFPDEGHGFARPVNSLAFFAITEAFLAKHLGGGGGRFEPIGIAVQSSTAQIEAGAELIPGLAPETAANPAASE